MTDQPAAGAATTAAGPRAVAGVTISREPLTPDGPVPPPQTGVGVRGFNGDIVDEWGRQSFPASDPPANW